MRPFRYQVDKLRSETDVTGNRKAQRVGRSDFDYVVARVRVNGGKQVEYAIWD